MAYGYKRKRRYSSRRRSRFARGRRPFRFGRSGFSSRGSVRSVGRDAIRELRKRGWGDAFGDIGHAVKRLYRSSYPTSQQQALGSMYVADPNAAAWRAIQQAARSYGSGLIGSAPAPMLSV